MAFRKGWIWIAFLVLVWGAAVNSYAGQETGLGKIVMPTGDMAVHRPSQPMEMLSTSDVTKINENMASYAGNQKNLLRNKAKNYYYYNNLEPVAKEIYDVMYGVAADPSSPGNIGLIMTFIDPSSDEFYFAFNMAYRAICFDHPELFWLYSRQEAEMCYGSEAVSQNGFYFVYIMMDEPFKNFETQMTAFNGAADLFLRDIDTGISEYETVKQIHDKLLRMVTYDYPVADHTVLSMKGQDLAHTAYGALVKDSSGKANLAVCDGYSLAFEYLLQQCGIESVFIGGMAGPDEEEAGMHAWNMVKIDGIWYEVDSTWDDSWGDLELDLEKEIQMLTEDDVYQYLLEALQDPGYRNKLDHFLFLKSTEEMRHFIPDATYDYISNDRTMQVNLPQECVHIRLVDALDPNDPDPEIIRLAPVALQNYIR